MTKKNTIIKGVTVGCLLFSGCLLSYLKKPNYIGFYLNDSKIDTLSSYDNTVFHKAICDNEANVSWNNDSKELSISNLKEKTRCNLYFVKATYDFDYTGSEQTFTAPVSGTYKLETWGAQGGYNEYSNLDSFGKGGYAVGYANLKKEEKIFINIGGQGKNPTNTYTGGQGGYNGGGAGGNGYFNDSQLFYGGGGGGGATHIALKSGLLRTLENSKSEILIVSGGGGGSTGGKLENDRYIGGNGGGFNGTISKKISDIGLISLGASQSSGYLFGQGQSGIASIAGDFGSEGNGGGGGGYYGGFSNQTTGEKSNSAGGGGSGYIGNSLLANKVMYCYNCEESTDENTKTISTTCNEETPTSNCSKKGNGYVRITLISIDE